MFNIDQHNTSLDYRSFDYQALDAETEKRLIILAREGDVEAKERLINHFGGIIFHRIHKMFPNASKEEREDMVQDSMALLLEVINKFDVSGKARLGTYFYNTISRGLPHMYWRSSLSTLSYAAWMKRHSITRKIDRYGLTWEEVENELGMKEGTAEAWIGKFTEAVHPEDGSVFESFVDEENPESIYIDNEDGQMLTDAISSLPEREQFIINHLYGINGYDRMTGKQVADELNISEPYMWNLRRRAINKIRELLTA